MYLVRIVRGVALRNIETPGLYLTDLTYGIISLLKLYKVLDQTILIVQSLSYVLDLLEFNLCKEMHRNVSIIGSSGQGWWGVVLSSQLDWGMHFSANLHAHMHTELKWYEENCKISVGTETYRLEVFCDQIQKFLSKRRSNTHYAVRLRNDSNSVRHGRPPDKTDRYLVF